VLWTQLGRLYPDQDVRTRSSNLDGHLSPSVKCQVRFVPEFLQVHLGQSVGDRADPLHLQLVVLSVHVWSQGHRVEAIL
jgi:hypothetical protein